MQYSEDQIYFSNEEIGEISITELPVEGDGLTVRRPRKFHDGEKLDF